MTETYLIDGVGNEVTVTLGVIIAIVIVVLSWLSTRVNETNFTTEEISATRHTVNSASRSNNQNEQVGASEDPNQATREQASETLDSTNGSVSGGAVQEPTVLRHRHNVSDESDTPTTSSASLSSQSQPSTSSTSSTPLDANTSSLRIKLKYLDETTQIVEANPDETLNNFRIRCLPQENQNRYRLIFRGQVLRDGTKTLRQLNLVSDQEGGSETVPVVHCFLSPVSDNQSNSATSASQHIQMMAEDMHIGSFMLPILGLCLACVWYLCIFHTSLFSIQSVVSIVGFSFLYITLIVNQFL